MTRKFRAIINVDLDGVVDSFTTNLRNFIAQRERIDPQDVVIPGWGKQDGKFDKWWRMGVQSGEIWGTEREQGPLPGARKYMWKLSDEEYFIRVVTTRLVQSFNHAKIITNTVQWLDRENIPYREIAFIGPGTKKSDFKADFAIDDRPKHVDEYAAAGIKGFLLNQPWNEDAETRGVRVDSWDEFYDRVTLSNRY